MNPVHLTWSWLNVLTKKRYDALLEVYGSLEAALDDCGEQLLKSLGVQQESVYRVLNRLEEFDASAYAKELERRNIGFVYLEDEAYPAKLKEVGDPPIFLYYQGDLSLLNQPCLAIVGTRDMSTYGKRVGEAIIPEISRNGMVTVSGLALGIDTLVATETMQAGGKTVAVLGNGLAGVYPTQNTKLAKHIVESGGLILSEYPLDVTPDKYTFPARNRIVAGVSLGTLVLEAGEGSGALITADLALDYNRDVFVVPGDVFQPTYKGCHAFLTAGKGKLVSTAADILQEYSIESSATGTVEFAPADDSQAALYEALTTMPQSAEELGTRSGLDAATLSTTLTLMELGGAVKKVGSGNWVRR